MSELRKNSLDPDGAGQSWKTCLRICNVSFPESPVFRCRTSGTCASSIWNTAVNYLLAHLNTVYEIGFERKECMEMPEGALREAPLNAMSHRDYRKPGDLQVHIFQDRVEVVNPGGLVGGLTLETLGTRSIPRNPLLFGMMHRMNLVEKVGSGLLRIRQMREAYPCPSSRIEADADWYRIIFSRSEAEKPAAADQVGARVKNCAVYFKSLGNTAALTSRNCRSTWPW